MISRALRAGGMVTLTAGAVSALAACSAGGGVGDGTGAPTALAASEIRIESLSTRPYLVTGGDVLLRVDLGSDLDTSQLEVSVNGRDVTQRFRLADEGGSLIGLIDGLLEGENEIEARMSGGGPTTTLHVTNYPISGPIISGPHQTPFLCQTEGFATAAGQTLGPPTDENCSVPTRVEYVYLSTRDHEFKPYDAQPNAVTPSDVAEATTLDGATVPFVVRVQTGTVNRAIYQSAMLHDPTDPKPDPWTRSRGSSLMGCANGAGATHTARATRAPGSPSALRR